MASEAAQPTGWYIAHESGESAGPMSDAEMRRAIGRGRVKPNDRVWRDGMDEWVEARRIPNYEEVRRSYKQGPERVVRQKPEKRERRQKQPRSNRPLTPRNSTSDHPRSAPPQPLTPSTPKSSSSPTYKDSNWDYSGPKPSSSDKLGGLENLDLEKMFGEAASKVGKIPPGAIVFFVLGFVFMPLLPVFWFIAWRIWAKANQK